MRHQPTSNFFPMSAPYLSPVLGRDDVFIVPTRDGSNTLFSRAHHATYHSLFGAVSESKHVFIQHGLKSLPERSPIRILEFGFGSGLNAFLAYLFAISHDREIEYTGIEAYPIDSNIAAQLDYPHYLAYPEEGDIFLRMHEEDQLASDSFRFRKIDSLTGIRSDDRFDCIFFDAFAPVHQPDLWDQDTFIALYSLLSPGGCFVTYCAQGEVRRRLIAAGFNVERLSGPTGKREMLRAQKPR